MMPRATQVALSRHALWRHLANLVAATLITLAISAVTSWVTINWIVGCGEMDPYGQANLDVCILHPANWE